MTHPSPSIPSIGGLPSAIFYVHGNAHLWYAPKCSDPLPVERFFVPEGELVGEGGFEPPTQAGIPESLLYQLSYTPIK